MKGHIAADKFTELEMPTLKLTFKSGKPNGNTQNVYVITMRPHIQDRVFCYSSVLLCGRRIAACVVKKSLNTSALFPESFHKDEQLDAGAFHTICTAIYDLVADTGKKSGPRMKPLIERFNAIIPGLRSARVTTYGFEKNATISIALSSFHQDVTAYDDQETIDKYLAFNKEVNAFIKSKAPSNKRQERDEDEETDSENEAQSKKARN